MITFLLTLINNSNVRNIILDTLTQIVLGGAIGYAVAGKQSPRKSLLYGATIATLPDLDVLIKHSDDLAAMTLHRSWTHSWIVHSLLAPLLALLMARIDKSFEYWRWCLLIWLALTTHSGLDAFTTYGTQLFWPFMPPPISGSSIFIIDPSYTLPLLIGFFSILFWPYSKRSRLIMRIGFAFSCAYLIWGLIVQNQIRLQAEQQLEQQAISNEQVHIIASPFNSFLWRILVIDDDAYYEGFRSIFDKKDKIEFTHYPRQLALLDSVSNMHSIEQLDWFTNGFFTLKQQNNSLIATDLRMGLEPNYVFSFNIAQLNNEKFFEATPPVLIRKQRNMIPTLKWIWQRIWDQSAKQPEYKSPSL